MLKLDIHMMIKYFLVTKLYLMMPFRIGIILRMYILHLIMFYYLNEKDPLLFIHSVYFHIFWMNFYCLNVRDRVPIHRYFIYSKKKCSNFFVSPSKLIKSIPQRFSPYIITFVIFSFTPSFLLLLFSQLNDNPP